MDRPQCPYCHSPRIHVYSVHGVVRYVRCRMCGDTFKMTVVYLIIATRSNKSLVPRGTCRILPPSDN